MSRSNPDPHPNTAPTPTPLPVPLTVTVPILYPIPIPIPIPSPSLSPNQVPLINLMGQLGTGFKALLLNFNHEVTWGGLQVVHPQALEYRL